jgi:hypothetical protein
MVTSSVFIIGSAIKIASVLGIGIGTTSLLSVFHNYEYKSKKKGEKNDNHSESLRERAKSLS